MKPSPTARKLLLTAVTVGVAAAVVAFGTFSAFSSTTGNPGNDFATGDLEIGDNDADEALYEVTNAKPGDASAARCIKVTYSGSLSSTVKLYRSSFGAGATGLEDEVDLDITRGTGDDFECAGFTPAGSGAAVYSGKLGDFPASYDAGQTLTGQGTPGTAVTYRVVASLPAALGNEFQDGATGEHSFTWEARSN